MVRENQEEQFLARQPGSESSGLCSLNLLNDQEKCFPPGDNRSFEQQRLKGLGFPSSDDVINWSPEPGRNVEPKGGVERLSPSLESGSMVSENSSHILENQMIEPITATDQAVKTADVAALNRVLSSLKNEKFYIRDTDADSHQRLRTLMQSLYDRPTERFGTRSGTNETNYRAVESGRTGLPSDPSTMPDRPLHPGKGVFESNTPPIGERNTEDGKPEDAMSLVEKSSNQLVENAGELGDKHRRKELVGELARNLGRLSPAEARASVDELNQRFSQMDSPFRFRIAETEGKRELNVRMNEERGQGEFVAIPPGKVSASEASSSPTKENRENQYSAERNDEGWDRYAPREQGEAEGGDEESDQEQGEAEGGDEESDQEQGEAEGGDEESNREQGEAEGGDEESNREQGETKGGDESDREQEEAKDGDEESGRPQEETKRGDEKADRAQEHESAKRDAERSKISGAVSETVKAVRSGDIKVLEAELRKAFERTSGDPLKFLEFNRQLSKELAKEGITVRFREAHAAATQLSLHRNGSPYGVELKLLQPTGSDKVEVRAQVYDWKSAEDVSEPKAKTVVADLFKSTEQKDFLAAGDKFATNLDASSRKASHEELAKLLQIVARKEGPEGVRAAVDALNEKLEYEKAPYKFSLSRDLQTKKPAYLVLRDATDGKETMLSMKPITDAAERRTENGPRKEPSEQVKVAVSAVVSGDLARMKEAFKDVFDKANGDATQFKKFSAELCAELKKEGITVLFPKGETKISQLSIHREKSKHAIDFQVSNTLEGSEVKAQAYDWETKKNVAVSAEKVAVEFKAESKERSETQIDRNRQSGDSQREQLESVAAKKYSAEDLREFRANLDKFAVAAKANKVSEQEVAKTLKACRELLEAPDRHFSSAERAKLAFQAVRQAADVSGIDQGRNNTCNSTCIEKMLYARVPSKPLEMLRDIATNGWYKTADNKVVTFKNYELRPDAEAQKLRTADGARSYASQITQLTLINSVWQEADSLPNGKKVGKGDIRYEKHDPTNESDTGERLMDYSQEPPAPYRETSGKVSTSPHFNLVKMISAWQKVTGDTPKDFYLARSENADHSVAKLGLHAVSKEGNLERFLSDLGSGKDGRQFPIVVMLGNVGALDGKSNGPVGGHVVTISGIERDKDGKLLVHIDNQYGSKQDKKVPLKTLWEAMSLKTLSVKAK